MEIIKKTIFLDNIELVSIFDSNDQFFDLFEKRFDTTIIMRGNSLIVKGVKSEIDTIEKIISEVSFLLKKNGEISSDDLTHIFELVTIQGNSREEVKNTIKSSNSDIIYHGYKDKIRLKNQKQRDYYKKVVENDLIFSIGPAGTGKTFLAVAMALDALKRNEVGRIILTRPAVEAGESLGFLPGDLNEKLDPYLRPLMDALQFMLSADKLKSLRERNIIEINPLAYMRGRTLNNAFIILDEAQNTTSSQMKMFLTRLGFGSKAIVTGDVTQVDLPNKGTSGLINISQILKNIKGISFIQFGKEDVVRHKLVAEIINAYEKAESSGLKK
ncbi:PhoH family protein [Candidatus Kapabacteria bacterium]|nr:PhoH family protein [Candidatus Kapabacteria bacterium]